MAFLFKRNPKTPGDLARAIGEQITKLDTVSDRKKTEEEITRHLLTVKTIINGEEGPFSDNPADAVAQLSQEIYSTDLLYLLITNLKEIEFDSRKIVVNLFNSMLRRKVGGRYPTIDYLLSKKKILHALMKGPETPETSINTGTMLREAIEYEPVAKAVIFDVHFWDYFKYVNSNSFEVSTDAFLTFNDLLMSHERIVAEFFSNQNNIDNFIQGMNRLITTGNYVTKREAIKLLADLIMQKHNYSLMTSYVNDPVNLKISMLLLGDKSKNIQLEGFNVFKVFVANPKKEKGVVDILTKNKEKLLVFLTGFNKEKNDEVFIAEKSFVIEQIQGLPTIIRADKGSENKSLTDETSVIYHKSMQ